MTAETADKAHVARPRGRRPAGAASGRESLMTAALASFAERGFERASLRDIAAAADVDMALIGRHFGSKAELWAAIVARLAARQSVHAGQLADLAALAEVEPAVAFERFIRLFAQISYEMPAFPAFLMQEASIPGERLDMLVRDLVAPFRAACAPIIRAAARAGVIRARDTDVYFGMLMSAVSLPMASPGLLLGGDLRGETLRNALADEAIAIFLDDQSDHSA